MARTTPHVEQETLTVGRPGAEHTIAVGSPAWFTWLETATAFTFACPRRDVHRAPRARQQRARRLVLAGVSAPCGRAAARLPGQSRRTHAGAVARGGGQPRQRWRAGVHPCSPRGGRQLRPPTRRTAPRAAEWDGDLPVHRHRRQHASCGSSTRRRCGRRWPATTRCCGRRLAPTAAWSSRPSAIASMPPSPGRPTRWPPRWRRSGRCSRKPGISPPRCACAWRCTRARRSRATATTSAPPLNRLARLLALGHGGQILLSRATHDLVADDLPAQTSLRALGDYQLKDLTRASRSSSVSAPICRPTFRRCARPSPPGRRASAGHPAAGHQAVCPTRSAHAAHAAPPACPPRRPGLA